VHEAYLDQSALTGIFREAMPLSSSEGKEPPHIEGSMPK
jgi:hypothetical protein